MLTAFADRTERLLWLIEAFMPECRWLDDGDDQELMYFEMDEGSGKSKSVEYMGVRVTHDLG